MMNDIFEQVEQGIGKSLCMHMMGLSGLGDIIWNTEENAGYDKDSGRLDKQVRVQTIHSKVSSDVFMGGINHFP